MGGKFAVAQMMPVLQDVEGNLKKASHMVAAAKALVDASLAHLYQPGMTAEALYAAYIDFGDDPFIVAVEGPRCEFSGWAYAQQRSQEMLRSSPPP